MRTFFSVWFLACLLQSAPAAAPEGFVIEWGWISISGAPAPARLVLSNAVAVSEGEFQGLALKSDGRVASWRATLSGQALGPKVPGSDKSARFVVVNGQVLSNVVSIAAATDFCLALKGDGTAVTWGENYIPPFATNITAIASELGFAWALRPDGTVFGWLSKPSSPAYGQLIPVSGLSNVVGIAVGRPGGYPRRGVALLRNGTLGTWGTETIHKDATPPAGLSNVVAAAAGSSHTLALKADGRIVGWGYNNVGQATGIPTPEEPCIARGEVKLNGAVLSNVVAIAANHGYSLALRKDGTVVGWGRMVNDLYPVTIPPGLSNVVAISAGESYCLAITTNPAVAARFTGSPKTSRP